MTRSAAFNQKFLDLKDAYLAKLPNQLRQIDSTWTELNTHGWANEPLESLTRHVHAIAGTAGSFGLEQLSDEAKALDGILRETVHGDAPPNFETKNQISLHIQKMQTSSNLMAGLVTSLPPTEQEKKHILIVDDDEDQAKLLELFCQELGCDTTVLDKTQDIAEFVMSHIPDLILLDIVFPEGQLAGIDALEKLYQDIGFRIPVVFTSARHDIASRIKAYRAGGLGYLSKPIDITELRVQLELLNNHRFYHAKILILDDDSDFNSYLATMLESQGFYTVSSTRPDQVLQLLDQHKPDLLLLDNHMPSIEGGEILSVLKQELKFSQLPIFLITADPNAKLIGLASAHGANGIIPKPIKFNILLDSIHGALKKSQTTNAKLETIIKQNSTEKCVNRSFFFAEVDKNLQLGEDSASNFLMTVSLKNHEQIRRILGVSHIDAISQQVIDRIGKHLQNQEYITHLSELHFAFTLKATDVQDLKTRLGSILKAVDDIHHEQGDCKFALRACMSAVELSPDFSSVDDVFNLAEQKILTLVTSKTSNLDIHSASESEQLSDADLKTEVSLGLEENRLAMQYQPIIDFENNEKIYEACCRLTDRNGVNISSNLLIQAVNTLKKQQEFNKAIIHGSITQLKSLHGQVAQETEIVIKPLLQDLSMLNFLAQISNSLKSSSLRGDNRLILSIHQQDLTRYTKQVAELSQGLSEFKCSLMIEAVDTHALNDNNFAEAMQNLKISYYKLDALTTKALAEKNAQALALYKTLRASNVPVIATHIEDNSMFSKIWELGVRHFQGYFIGQPTNELSFDFGVENHELK